MDTLIQDGINIDDSDLLNERANIIQTNESFIERVTDIYNNLEYVNSKKINIEEQIYTEGFPSSIEKDRFNQFHSAQSYGKRVNIIKTFDDERYKEFAYRICAQEHTEEVDSEILISLKELTRSRFNDEGPWPNSLQNLEEGKSLLLEANNKEEKQLINLAINSIKNSL